MKKTLLVVFILALSLTVFGTAYAAEVSGTLDVIINTPLPSCTVSTIAVLLNNPDCLSPTTGTGDVTVNCGNGTPYNIALDAGLNYDGLWRGAVDPISLNRVSYGLFQDAGFTTEWGDSDFLNTYPYGSSLLDTGNGLDQPHMVYGQDETACVPGDTYNDTVGVTVYY